MRIDRPEEPDHSSLMPIAATAENLFRAPTTIWHMSAVQSYNTLKAHGSWEQESE